MAQHLVVRSVFTKFAGIPQDVNAAFEASKVQYELNEAVKVRREEREAAGLWRGRGQGRERGGGGPGSRGGRGRGGAGALDGDGALSGDGARGGGGARVDENRSRWYREWSGI